LGRNERKKNINKFQNITPLPIIQHDERNINEESKERKNEKKKKAGDKIERDSNNLEFDQSPTNTAAVLVVESL
jgi:hypothetical protein